MNFVKINGEEFVNLDNVNEIFIHKSEIEKCYKIFFYFNNSNNEGDTTENYYSLTEDETLGLINALEAQKI